MTTNQNDISSILFHKFHLICQMLAKFSGLNAKGPSLSLEQENFCVVLTYSIKQASEIRKFHTVVQQWLRKCTKKHNTRAKLFFCQSKPIACLLAVPYHHCNNPYCCDPEILLPW